MTLHELRSSGRAVITVTEAAGVLEVDERTVRRACHDGQLPSLRVGTRLLIPREQFLALFALVDDQPVPDEESTDQPWHQLKGTA